VLVSMRNDQLASSEVAGGGDTCGKARGGQQTGPRTIGTCGWHMFTRKTRQESYIPYHKNMCTHPSPFLNFTPVSQQVKEDKSITVYASILTSFGLTSHPRLYVHGVQPSGFASVAVPHLCFTHDRGAPLHATAHRYCHCPAACIGHDERMDSCWDSTYVLRQYLHKDNLTIRVSVIECIGHVRNWCVT
jgi:hypothetical protein